MANVGSSTTLIIAPPSRDDDGSTENDADEYGMSIVEQVVGSVDILPESLRTIALSCLSIISRCSTHLSAMNQWYKQWDWTSGDHHGAKHLDEKCHSIKKELQSWDTERLRQAVRSTRDKTSDSGLVLTLITITLLPLLYDLDKLVNLYSSRFVACRLCEKMDLIIQETQSCSTDISSKKFQMRVAAEILGEIMDVSVEPIPRSWIDRFQKTSSKIDSEMKAAAEEEEEDKAQKVEAASSESRNVLKLEQKEGIKQPPLSAPENLIRSGIPAETGDYVPSFTSDDYEGISASLPDLRHATGDLHMETIAENEMGDKSMTPELRKEIHKERLERAKYEFERRQHELLEEHRIRQEWGQDAGIRVTPLLLGSSATGSSAGSPVDKMSGRFEDYIGMKEQSRYKAHSTRNRTPSPGSLRSFRSLNSLQYPRRKQSSLMDEVRNRARNIGPLSQILENQSVVSHSKSSSRLDLRRKSSQQLQQQRTSGSSGTTTTSILDELPIMMSAFALCDDDDDGASAAAATSGYRETEPIFMAFSETSSQRGGGSQTPMDDFMSLASGNDLGSRSRASSLARSVPGFTNLIAGDDGSSNNKQNVINNTNVEASEYPQLRHVETDPDQENLGELSQQHNGAEDISIPEGGSGASKITLQNRDIVTPVRSYVPPPILGEGITAKEEIGAARSLYLKQNGLSAEKGQTPPKNASATLEQKINMILEDMPHDIHMTPAHTSMGSPAGNVHHSNGSPSVVSSLSGHGSNNSGYGETRQYQINKPDGTSFTIWVRIVSERVMVRVGGGYTDLSEWLYNYAMKHGVTPKVKDSTPLTHTITGKRKFPIGSTSASIISDFRAASEGHQASSPSAPSLSRQYPLDNTKGSTGAEILRRLNLQK